MLDEGANAQSPLGCLSRRTASLLLTRRPESKCSVLRTSYAVRWPSRSRPTCRAKCLAPRTRRGGGARAGRPRPLRARFFPSIRNGASSTPIFHLAHGAAGGQWQPPSALPVLAGAWAGTHANGSQSYTGIRHGRIGAEWQNTDTSLHSNQLTEVNMNWNTRRMGEYGNSAADRVQSFADGAKSTAADMRSRASDLMETSADWASKKTDDLNATSRELVASMSDAVSTRPLLAVGIAIFAGFLISKLFSRD